MYKLNHAGSFDNVKRIELERMVNGSLMPEIMVKKPCLKEQAEAIIDLARQYKFDDAIALMCILERKLGES